MRLIKGNRVHLWAVAGVGGALLLLAITAGGTTGLLFEDEISVRGPASAALPADPTLVVRISELSAEREAAEGEGLARIRELNAWYTAAEDRAERTRLAAEIREAKRALERRNMELGLEIAILRGRDDRAAHFAAALEGVDR